MGRLMLIVILTACHLLFGAPEFFLGSEHYWLRSLSYSFFHASWWHLAVNCIAIWGIYNPRRRFGLTADCILPYVIAVAVYPLSLHPVIGFSNILYAVLGLRTPALSSPWWRKPAVVVFIVVSLAMLFVPQLSATTHIAAFLLGMGCSALKRGYNNLIDDAKRYL